MSKEFVHSLKIGELFNKDATFSKTPINYMNYTKSKYDILNLRNYNEYYQRFQKQIPDYIRDQPEWDKFLYKRKTCKIDRDNYIIFRNVMNAKNYKKGILRSTLYRSLENYRPKTTRTISSVRKKQPTGTTSSLENTITVG